MNMHAGHAQRLLMRAEGNMAHMSSKWGSWHSGYPHSASEIWAVWASLAFYFKFNVAGRDPFGLIEFEQSLLVGLVFNGLGHALSLANE